MRFQTFPWTKSLQLYCLYVIVNLPKKKNTWKLSAYSQEVSIWGFCDLFINKNQVDLVILGVKMHNFKGQKKLRTCYHVLLLDVIDMLSRNHGSLWGPPLYYTICNTWGLTHPVIKPPTTCSLSECLSVEVSRGFSTVGKL